MNFKYVICMCVWNEHSVTVMNAENIECQFIMKSTINRWFDINLQFVNTYC